MLPRPHTKSTMRLLLSIVLVAYAAEAAKKFEGTLRSAVDAPPQDNLAIESGSPEPAVVAAPESYQNPGAPPPEDPVSEEPAEEPSAAAAVPETASGGVPPSAPSGASAPSAPANSLEECDPEMIGFELVTGYVFSAPSHILDDIPGTLMLTDCLEQCQANDTCRAVNYETGLCVLFGSDADQLPGALTKSQFPVFTIYAQKSCLGVRPCERAWCFDRVRGYHLKGRGKRTHTVGSRQMCLDLCLGENEFVCRSANYNNKTGECVLSNMDRITLAGTNSFQPNEDTDYLENNCVEEPTKLCEFKKMGGRILKTVDSVYQDVQTVEECRELCLNSPFRCHSYDHGDTGDHVCRLSHHSRATLADIQDPYLEVPEAATYELSSCYNVSIDCRAGDMVAKIQTSKLFDGKIYAKGSPNSCVVDVKQSLEFELHMGYNNLECNVKQNGLGRYLNDVVIQHHDTIVTSSDLGLAVTCQYDLTNKTVANEVDLGIHGDIQTGLSEEVIVDSPNVAMRITDRNGDDTIASAEVGDPLALRFEIMDPNSPFEIFVRELVAAPRAPCARYQRHLQQSERVDPRAGRGRAPLQAPQQHRLDLAAGLSRRGGGRRALRGDVPVGRRGPGAGAHARRGGAAQPRLRLRRRTHARAPRHQIPAARDSIDASVTDIRRRAWPQEISFLYRPRPSVCHPAPHREHGALQEGRVPRAVHRGVLHVLPAGRDLRAARRHPGAAVLRAAGPRGAGHAGGRAPAAAQLARLAALRAVEPLRRRLPARRAVPGRVGRGRPPQHAARRAARRAAAARPVRALGRVGARAGGAPAVRAVRGAAARRVGAPGGGGGAAGAGAAPAARVGAGARAAPAHPGVRRGRGELVPRRGAGLRALPRAVPAAAVRGGGLQQEPAEPGLHARPLLGAGAAGAARAGRARRRAAAHRPRRQAAARALPQRRRDVRPGERGAALGVCGRVAGGAGGATGTAAAAPAAGAAVGGVAQPLPPPGATDAGPGAAAAAGAARLLQRRGRGRRHGRRVASCDVTRSATTLLFEFTI